MGAPVFFVRDGRRSCSTHLLSTIPGKPGRVELLTFGKRLGLRQEWLQRIGSEFEHFDAIGWKRITTAKTLCAKEVDRRRLVEIVRMKRSAKTGEARRRAYAYAMAVRRNAERVPA